MKVALYARVSLDERADDKRFQDPENQLKPLREFAGSMGWEVVKEYVDKASGANPARPAFRKMLQDAMMRRFSGVVVWKLDRFSREGVINTFAYIKQLKDRGVWLRSQTEAWLDTSNEGITQMVLAVMSWAAAEERKKISERTKAGIARRRAIGQWRGGRPRKLPEILSVCVKGEGGFFCKECGKRFRDLKEYQRKWNAHRKRHEQKGSTFDAGIKTD